MIDLQTHANMLGFRGIYLLKPEPYVHFQIRRKEGTLHENSRHVSDDPTRDYPWANSVLVLLYPYQPYPKTVAVSGYYPASNRSYHAAGILINRLRDRGIRAERAALPVRETLLRHGIGIACKNGLTAVMPFGTRFIVQILVLSAPSEMLLYRIDTQVKEYKSCSEHCDHCASACPAGAVSKNGMCFTDCIRADMDGERNVRTNDAAGGLSFGL